jgi:hypothetical protein
MVGKDSDYGRFLQQWATTGLKSLCAIFKIPDAIDLELFEYYVWKMDTQHIATESFWEHFPMYLPLHDPKSLYEQDLRQQGIWIPESGCTPTATLVEIGRRMAAFPATECTCERLFCNLRNLVGDFRQSMKARTLKDLLSIRVHQLWNEDSGNEMHEVAARLQVEVDDESIARAVHLETD